MNKITDSKLLYRFAMLLITLCANISQTEGMIDIVRVARQSGNMNSELRRLSDLFGIPHMNNNYQVNWGFNPDNREEINSELSRVQSMNRNLRRESDRALQEVTTENYSNAVNIIRNQLWNLTCTYSERRENTIIFFHHQLNWIEEANDAFMTQSETDLLRLIKSNVDMVIGMYRALCVMREMRATGRYNQTEIVNAFRCAETLGRRR